MPVSSDGVVACGACGVLVPEATERVQSLVLDVQLLERELRAKRRQVRDLRAEQDSKLTASPHYAAAMRVLERWKERCMPDARELTGNHRLERAIARMKPKDGFSEVELMEAIEGYARFPYMVDRDRSPAGRSDQWYADAELIFRTPGHVKRGIAMARQELRFPVGVLGMVSWRQVREANRRAMVGLVTARFGQPLAEDGRLLSPCPSCSELPHVALTLSIEPMSSNLPYLADCHACGLGDERLLRLVRDAATLAPPPVVAGADGQLAMGAAA